MTTSRAEVGIDLVNYQSVQQLIGVSEAAGISRTLIFHHFESKKKLYLTIVERQFETSAPELSGFSPEGSSDYFEAFYGTTCIRPTN